VKRVKTEDQHPHFSLIWTAELHAGAMSTQESNHEIETGIGTSKLRASIRLLQLMPKSVKFANS
jgi:hypothetical protein